MSNEHMPDRDSRPPHSFAIVPAAGRSRRMGEDKLMLPWGKSTVIESVLAAWLTSRVDEIIVVMRRDQRELRALCGKLSERLSIVIPAIDPPEMKDSVLAALESIQDTFSPEDRDAWLLAPADMPQLDPNIVDRVLAGHQPSTPTIIVPTSAGKRGHPVLFPWALASAVRALSKTEGVNALIARHPVREVDCGLADIHGDLDTPEDYRRLRRDEPE